jgi:hypothetical protein
MKTQEKAKEVLRRRKWEESREGRTRRTSVDKHI